jgi:hypothetical protein
MAAGSAAARFLCARRPYSASRILDATQIRRLSAFSFAAEVTIQHFTCRAVAAREGGTNHDSEAKCSPNHSP